MTGPGRNKPRADRGYSAIVPTILIQTPGPAGGPSKPELFSSAAWLWLGFTLLAVLLVAGGWTIMSRQRRQLMEERRKRPSRPIKDAWTEAGRRAEPITIDEDPPEQGEPR